MLTEISDVDLNTAGRVCYISRLYVVQACCDYVLRCYTHVCVCCPTLDTHTVL